MLRIDRDLVGELYREYAEPLSQVRDQQRALMAKSQGGMKFQLDDIEAELTYLLIRRTRPERVVEIGALHGWSTTWILSALRDNETGHLHSYDRIDNALSNVPPGLSRGRWTFVPGDVRDNLDALPTPDYLFLDAAHSAGFARWYLRDLFPRVRPGTPVSVHDVFHTRFLLPFTEGRVVCRYLADHQMPYFSASNAREPETHRWLTELRREVGITEPVRTGQRNPMIFFTRPAESTANSQVA